MECKTLSDICLRICSGGTPKRSCREYYDGGTIPWLNTAEVNFNRIRSTASHITEQGLDNSSTRWVPKDTVIVAMYGATAGRVAIAGIPLTTNQACCNLVIDCALADPKYVYYWLKNRHCEIAGLANGGAQQNLSVRVLKEVEIVLPALSVQHAVADYLAVLDEKIELNSRINDHLLEYARTIFEKWLASTHINYVPVADIAEFNPDNYSPREQWPLVQYLDTGNITRGIVESYQAIDPQSERLPSRARRKVTSGDIIYSSVRPIQKHYGLILSPAKSVLVSTGFTVNYSANAPTRLSGVAVPMLLTQLA